MRTELGGNTSSLSLQNSAIFSAQSSLSGALRGCIGTLDGDCTEKLLLHCARALEANDITLAQQVLWVLNNVASQTGDQNQRLTSWFLRALVSRASRVCPSAMSFNGSHEFQRRVMTVTELARYVDVIPWHRFGFSAANGVIYKAIQKHPKVHILDFSISHCMQWPTLIDALAKRKEGPLPPSLRVSVPSFRPPVPPLLDAPAEELGLRLANFACSKDVSFEFNMIDVSSEPSNSQLEALMNKLNPTSLNLREDEALVINCQHFLRYISDEQDDENPSSLRDAFLRKIKKLNPRIMVVADEDSDVGSQSLSSRITTCFNFLWMPFDALETFLPKDSAERLEYEADIGHRIENIVSFEGHKRVERSESCAKLSQRMKTAGYCGEPIGEEAAAEVKALLTEQASGWGMKREEDNLVLTWKGHNSVFVTAWAPMEMEEDQEIVA